MQQIYPRFGGYGSSVSTAWGHPDVGGYGSSVSTAWGHPDGTYQVGGYGSSVFAAWEHPDTVCIASVVTVPQYLPLRDALILSAPKSQGCSPISLAHNIAVPIEILGLENLLTERVYIKWADEDGCWTLGSCMPGNKKNVEIIMKVVCNSKSKRDVHIQFSIKVTIKISGKRHYMYMLLAVPPHGDFEYASEDLSIQKLNDLSHLDASALHEAGISNLERIIVLNFDIRFAGFVVQKEKESTTILNWTHFKHKEPRDQPPPRYTAKDTQRPAEVQVPRSPLIAYIDTKSSPRIDEAIIPVTPSPVPVCHGIFSPNPEELSDVGEDSHLDDYKDSGRIETCLEMEVNSDEEYLAKSNARELDEEYLTDIRETSQQPRQDATSEALGSEFREWLNAAAKLNPNVLEHRGLTSKLLTLGESVRESDIAKFDAIRPWCSALLFYNPTDSSSTSELQDSMHRLLVSDMAGLIKSINTFQRGAEMTFLMEDFLKLGSAARAGNKEQYTCCKVECQFRILVNEKSRKGLSRKRNISEIDRNVHKRIRTAA
ncbi:uncharacterized protein EAE98_003929 [Botrytis deweyae]|uniref:Uncharacterized protein n=1 Tax=Botrytis deweyae TaxID=2478750 RepID=A0ABQ7IS51_9HELO|nr:uncharacterized protein EAE98_003929 [Botrytis deweyae]KAF7932630.1 hypothetical protein EAE98_003929 [Botrytis deweyae]